MGVGIDGGTGVATRAGVVFVFLFVGVCVCV